MHAYTVRIALAGLLVLGACGSGGETANEALNAQSEAVSGVEAKEEGVSGANAAGPVPAPDAAAPVSNTPAPDDETGIPPPGEAPPEAEPSPPGERPPATEDEYIRNRAG
jgi:hypothetical protein